MSKKFGNRADSVVGIMRVQIGETSSVSGEWWLQSRKVTFWQSFFQKKNPYHCGNLRNWNTNLAIFI